MMKITPIIKVERTTVDVQPLSPTDEKPYSKLPKPMVESTKDAKSNFGLDVSKTLAMKKKPAIRTIATIGTIKPNKSRHDKLSITHPEKVGPMAGAKPITIPAVPMAAPRLSAGKIDSIIV